LLREVGAISEARTMAEEAYKKATDNKQKHDAARQRSLIPIDLDDQITWLDRSDTSSLEVKAHLSMCRGDKAMQEGDDQAAAKHLRDGLGIYEQLPEAAATLNNRAILLISLFQATGDAKALDKRAALLQKAIVLQPSDSILLSNAAEAVEEVALRDLIGPALDLKTLKIQGNLHLLDYLYKDQAGKDQYVQRVRDQKGVGRAIRIYNRLLVLSSKSALAYRALTFLYSYTEDLNAMRGLWNQLEKVDLDLADSMRETLEGYKGKKDEKRRKDLQASIKRYEGLVKATRKDPGGGTFAVAATTLVGLKIGGEIYGLEGKADEVVALAEEAYKAAPSNVTQWTLVTALLFRAGGSLAEQEPSYAAMRDRARRSLGASELIAVALSRDEKLRSGILGNKDVQRAIDLLKDWRQKFPKVNTPWIWAMLKAADPEEAAQVAKGVLKDEIGKIKRSIDLKLSPLSASTALHAYWAMQIAGQEEKGLALLKRCAERGAPLPFDVK
jgi:hypothetical protein